MGFNTINLKELSESDIDRIAYFAKKLNPEKSIEELTLSINEMFSFNNYHCFGLYSGEKIVGISSCWVTVRFYSGKQIELDNVIIDDKSRSSGFGRKFLELIEVWAKENGCKTIELNTYVQNSRSHKFYFNQGYSILGFHFQKYLQENQSRQTTLNRGVH
jgi:GNAT superfamily N-acetyltransferase